MDNALLVQLLAQQAPKLLQSLQKETDGLNIGVYQENKDFGIPMGGWTPEAALQLYPNIGNAVDNGYDLSLMNDEFNLGGLDAANKALATDKPSKFPSDALMNPLESDPSNAVNPNALKWLYDQLVRETWGRPERMPAADAALTFTGFYR